MEDKDSSKEKAKDIAIGCIGLILIIALVWFIFHMCTASEPSENPPPKPFTTTLIALVAQDLVRDYLLTPSVAKFSNITVYSFKSEPKLFKVTGYVDSQNAFGAMLRKQFEIIFEYQGSIDDSTSRKLDTDNWKIIYFNMY